MRLKQRGLAFDRITRHVRVTQCLAALGGGEWLLPLAPARAGRSRSDADPTSIQAFRISGPVGIKLHRGTWHVGPFFEAPEMDFLNVELADTNETGHVNCHLARDHGVSLRFDVGCSFPSFETAASRPPQDEVIPSKRNMLGWPTADPRRPDWFWLDDQIR